MIFVSDRGAKQRQDTVTHRLGEKALVAMHGLHYEVEGRVDNEAGLFGVEAFDERGGAFDVGKEDGDGLAFAIRDATGFHSRLFGEDALGEMSGGPESRVRSPESGLVFLFAFCPFALFPFCLCERRAAVAAKQKFWRVVKAALQAAVAELGSAPAAEPHTLWVVESATCAMHPRISGTWVERRMRKNARETLPNALPDEQPSSIVSASPLSPQSKGGRP